MYDALDDAKKAVVPYPELTSVSPRDMVQIGDLQYIQIMIIISKKNVVYNRRWKLSLHLIQGGR